MKISHFFVIALFLGANLTHADSLQVVSFNTGLLREFGINAVDCVPERVAPQINAYNSLLKKPFVLNLQEVWTKDALKTYTKWATKQGYNIYYQSPTDNGSLIISSEPISEGKFIPFLQNDPREHSGVLYAVIALNGKRIKMFNTHTAFSGPTAVDTPHISQLQQIADILRENKNDYSIFAGDINAGPDVTIGEEQYNPIEEIWQKAFINLLPSEWFWTGAVTREITWDQSHNPLVYHPARVLRFLGRYAQIDSSGSWGWSDAQIDHIFITRYFRLEGSNRILDFPVTIPGCPINPTRLSDHYGWEVKVLPL